MKTITTDKMTIGLVEVPDGANLFEVFNDDNPYISFWLEIRTPRLYLHPGNYTFLSTTKELTEEVAKEVCGYGGIELMHKTAKAALNTILTANGIDPSKNYAILEIKK